MWLLWVLAFVMVFLILAQLISRLPGENFAGLRKVIPLERPSLEDGIASEKTLERMTGEAQPFFETMLVLEEKSPEQLLLTWRLARDYYANKLETYHQEHVDLDKAVVRLSYTGGRRIYEDYPIRLADNALDIIINAPGSTITAELGFYTAEHNFIPLAMSNEVTIAG